MRLEQGSGGESCQPSKQKLKLPYGLPTHLAFKFSRSMDVPPRPESLSALNLCLQPSHLPPSHLPPSHLPSSHLPPRQWILLFCKFCFCSIGLEFPMNFTMSYRKFLFLLFMSTIVIVCFDQMQQSLPRSYRIKQARHQLNSDVEVTSQRDLAHRPLAPAIASVLKHEVELFCVCVCVCVL